MEQYLESESPVHNHSDPDEPCPICLEALSAAAPPNQSGTEAFRTRYCQTLLCCSAGHSLHANCLVDWIFSQGDGRPVHDSCPQCRRRMFADTRAIIRNIKRYEDRGELSGARVMLANFHVVNGVAQFAGWVHVVGEQRLGFNLLHQSDYECGEAAWVDVAVAFGRGDVDEFTAAMDRAEEVDRNIERREMGL